MQNKTIISVMIEEISSSKTDNSRELEDFYERSNRYDKTIINGVFIRLCGWTFEDLQELAEEGE